MTRHPDIRKRDTAVRLQARDVDLLTELFLYGCMSREQIQALYFGSKPRTNARLRKLYDAGFVDRATLPCSVIGVASAPLVYLPAAASALLIAAHTARDPDDVRALLRKGTPGYLQHTLRIVDFRLLLEATVRNYPDVTLCSFLPERCCQHAYQVREERADGQGFPWRTEVYKPDAVFVLKAYGVQSAFAVEIDLGNTAASEFQTKLSIHARYRVLGLFAKRYDLEKTATLIVTVSAGRCDNLRILAERETQLHTGFTTFDALSNAGILEPIWHRPGSSEPESLLTWKEAPVCSA